MSKIVNFLIGGLALLSVTSCVNDFLEVEPVSDLTSETFWKTPKDAESGLNAVYAQMAINYGSSSNLNFLMWFEGRAADTWHAQYMDVNGVNVNTNNIHSGMSVTSWNGYYSAIGRANYALYYLDKMEGVAVENKNHYLAEASFLRAKMYFDMVTIWGDVPLITEPTLDPDLSKMYVSRTSKDEVMTQILTDLDVAITKVNPTVTDVSKFNIGAAYALQAHVAMWNHDFQTAYSATTELIKLNRYGLQSIDNWTKIFSEGNTSENIWTIKWNYANMGNNQSLDKLGRETSALSLNKEFIEEWETYTDDKRTYLSYDTARTFTWETHLLENCYGLGLWKWYGPESPGRLEGQNEHPFIIYRLADIYLLRAEAANQLGKEAEALKYLNLVRNRAGMTDITAADYPYSVDKTSLEELILWERKVELLGEGHRWNDLVRTGRARDINNEVFQTYYTTWGLTSATPFSGSDCELLFPINADDMIESKGHLEQSPCY
ncbi:RagB/SusD family nutrient uptake outer membrane protein [uncultured Draconibacterium sp.]|uniref:RagB/SusD family nutrient uptake outer membrane protein n=1 Tax=uncultured Draconibacterium sp. TaxID=1573823 RepID=UPI0029C6957C|nr:RagB/SusD family nutrient uptake outer membrane protein [uncultured Draconibacterium sp.]